ncbi:hypothetical protein EDC96DRAFT_565380 [Choanephora cucurbitarum]|nr:hypothetical protein EDC96DRAFT_565380 [Choanephora cucurbitarum]
MAQAFLSSGNSKENLKTYYSFRKANLNVAEEEKGLEAHEISLDIACFVTRKIGQETRYVARITLPLRPSLIDAASVSFHDVEDSQDTEEAEGMGRNDYLESIQKYHSFPRSINQQKLDKKDFDKPLRVLSKM